MKTKETLTDADLLDQLNIYGLILDDLIQGLMACNTGDQGFSMKGDGIFHIWMKFHELHKELYDRYSAIGKKEPKFEWHMPPRQ